MTMDVVVHGLGMVAPSLVVEEVVVEVAPDLILVEVALEIKMEIVGDLTTVAETRRALAMYKKDLVTQVAEEDLIVEVVM